MGALGLKWLGGAQEISALEICSYMYYQFLFCFFFLFVFHFFLGLVHGVKFCSGVLRYNFKILAGVFIFCSVFFFFPLPLCVENHFHWKKQLNGCNLNPAHFTALSRSTYQPFYVCLKLWSYFAINDSFMTE